MTLKLLEDMVIAYSVISRDTIEDEIIEKMKEFQDILGKGRQAAFVIKKGALEFAGEVKYENNKTMIREEIIKHIVEHTGNDSIVSTTGKASRELFEIRETGGHGCDFLTVGSMGHAYSIALGVALQKPDKKIWIIDGDGTVLMHMGAMTVLGANSPRNIVHVVLNNGAHETVGGMPTVAGRIDLVTIAEGCSYPNAVIVDPFEDLGVELEAAKLRNELSFIEVKCSIGARENLGRPIITGE